MRSGARTFLIFSLEGRDYGVDVAQVKEIIGMPEFTAVPRSLGGLRGAIHFRGTVIPLVDLRLRFSLASCCVPVRPCVIVVEGKGPARGAVGVVVDAVSDVVAIAGEDMMPPGEYPPLEENAFLGAGKVGDHVVPLFDMTKVLDVELWKAGQGARGEGV